jgi:hypothetical protein
MAWSSREKFSDFSGQNVDWLADRRVGARDEWLSKNGKREFSFSQSFLMQAVGNEREFSQWIENSQCFSMRSQ